MSETPQPKANPFERLTPEQRERGRKLISEIHVGKVTVSFSIEDRDPSGRKKSCFYSVSASKGEEGENPQGYSLMETQIVRVVLSKHVVQATYEDAFRRKVLQFSEENVRERDAVVASYDEKLAHLLASEESK